MTKSKYNKANIENIHMKLPNSSYWSPCSVKAIQEFVSTASCLFNEPWLDEYPLFDWQDMAAQIEGGPPSLADQCSTYEFPALPCGKNPCQYLECQAVDRNVVTDVGAEYSCIPQEKNYAMEGTSCGDEKFCFQGNCIKGNNHISFKEIILPFHFGNAMPTCLGCFQLCQNPLICFLHSLLILERSCFILSNLADFALSS